MPRPIVKCENCGEEYARHIIILEDGKRLYVGDKCFEILKEKK